MLKTNHHKPTTMKASKPYSLPVILIIFFPRSSIITPPDVKTPTEAVNQASKVMTWTKKNSH
jgi:hypothetical protein